MAFNFQLEPIQADSCVILTWPYHFLAFLYFLASQDSPGLSYTHFLYQIWNQLFPQRALVSFIGNVRNKEYELQLWSNYKGLHRSTTIALEGFVVLSEALEFLANHKIMPTKNKITRFIYFWLDIVYGGNRYIAI